MLQKAFEQIKASEAERGIFRFFVPSEVEYVRKVGRYAFVKAGKATIPSLKQKAIRNGLPLYAETEALRVLISQEIQSLLGRERIRDNCSLDVLKMPFPSKATPGRYADLTYLDVKSCFWDIYRRLGIDCRCNARAQGESLSVRSLAKGRIHAGNSYLVANLKEYKRLRNSLVGLMSSCFSTVYTGQKFKRQFYRSKILNLELRLAINVVLHVCLSDVWNDVIYWNVDGGFVRGMALDKLSMLFDLFDVRIKHAKTLTVTCLGGYSWEDVDGNIRTSGHFNKKGHNVNNFYTIKNRGDVVRWVSQLMKI